MHEQSIIRALNAVGITSYRCESGITDETTYLQKLRVVIGVTDEDEPQSILGDPPVDWATFKSKYDEIYASFPMEQLRIERDILLTTTDWTQNPDVPEVTRNKWVTYRQQLRDLPETSTPTLGKDGVLDHSSINWPTKPS